MQTSGEEAEAGRNMAPRQNPFLLSQLVFDDNGQLSPMPRVESIIQGLIKSLQSIKTSALKVSDLGRGWALGIPSPILYEI